MINHNLAGKALTHCLGVPGAKLLLLDEDPAFRTRIEDEREVVEGELGMKIMVLEHDRKSEILSVNSDRPDDVHRSQIKGNSPMCMFFTRFVMKYSLEDSLLILILLVVGRLVCLKDVLSTWIVDLWRVVRYDFAL